METYFAGKRGGAMKKLVVLITAVLILAGLAIPALAQGEGLDLSPVAGKFKIVFRNCLRVSVKADVKGIDFWEGEIPGWVDVPECPYRVALVNTSFQGGDRYRGTMGTTFNAESFSLNYEFDSAPGGVTIVSFLNEHTVEVKPVDTSKLSPATPGPPTEEPTATTSAQPAATGAEQVAAPATPAQPAATGAEQVAAPATSAAPITVPTYSSAPGTFANVPPYVASENSAPILPGSTPVYSARPQPAPVAVLPATGVVSIKSPWLLALVGLLLAFVARRIARLRE
jgi:hypothetical protein